MAGPASTFETVPGDPFLRTSGDPGATVEIGSPSSSAPEADSSLDTSSPLAARAGLIQSPETMATVAHAIIRDRYGDEAYWWDPLTVAMELKADFGADPCPEFMDRWSAMQVVMTGDAFFKRIDAFFAVCNAFSDGDPFFGAFDPVTVEEAAWAVAEVGMNRDMLPFSPTIRDYCRVILEKDGYGTGSLPPVFRLVFADADGADGGEGGRPTLKDVKRGLVSDANGAALKAYLMDNAGDVARQLDAIPDLKNLDDDLLKKGLVAALEENKR